VKKPFREEEEPQQFTKNGENKVLPARKAFLGGKGGPEPPVGIGGNTP